VWLQRRDRDERRAETWNTEQRELILRLQTTVAEYETFVQGIIFFDRPPFEGGDHGLQVSHRAGEISERLIGLADFIESEMVRKAAYRYDIGVKRLLMSDEISVADAETTFRRCSSDLMRVIDQHFASLR
jgi:hypothetical protein